MVSSMLAWSRSGQVSKCQEDLERSKVKVIKVKVIKVKVIKDKSRLWSSLIV